MNLDMIIEILSSQSFISVVVLVAAIIAILELWQITKSNKLIAFLELIKYIQDEKVREARRVLIGELGVKNKDYKKWSEAEKEQVEIACHAYNFAGLMADHNLIKKDFVARGWRDSIIKCWSTAEPKIMDDRKKRGGNFLDKFKMLYDKAKEIDDKEFSSFSQKQVKSWKSKKQKRRKIK